MPRDTRVQMVLGCCPRSHPIPRSITPPSHPGSRARQHMATIPPQPPTPKKDTRHRHHPNPTQPQDRSWMRVLVQRHTTAFFRTTTFKTPPPPRQTGPGHTGLLPGMQWGIPGHATQQHIVGGRGIAWHQARARPLPANKTPAEVLGKERLSLVTQHRRRLATGLPGEKGLGGGCAHHGVTGVRRAISSARLGRRWGAVCRRSLKKGKESGLRVKREGGRDER